MVLLDSLSSRAAALSVPSAAHVAEQMVSQVLSSWKVANYDFPFSV